MGPHKCVLFKLRSLVKPLTHSGPELMLGPGFEVLQVLEPTEGSALVDVKQKDWNECKVLVKPSLQA